MITSNKISLFSSSSFWGSGWAWPGPVALDEPAATAAIYSICSLHLEHRHQKFPEQNISQVRRLNVPVTLPGCDFVDLVTRLVRKAPE